LSNVYVEIEGRNFLRYVKGDIKGNGTENSPYCINQNNEFPKNVKVIKSEYFIDYSGIRFDGFGVIDSKNINFTNCSFNSITLHRSENSLLNNCEIVSLYLRNGKNCYFKECSINVIHNFFSSGNVFENCEIGNPQALKMDIIGASEFHKIILYLMLFLIATLFPDIYFSIVYWNNYFSIIGISIVITILGLIYLSIKRGGKKYERRPNIIRDSWKSKLQENH
jgi:hypothetical protein